MAGLLRRLARRHVVLLIGIAILGTGGVLTLTEQAARQSETLEFCVSCHVMDATVFKEYKQTSHYSNASGMRATCADCHLPDRHAPGEVVSYLSTKLGAARFVYSWATGRNSDPAQLVANREQLAERVWARMRADDSRACRRCHDDAAWNLAEQTSRAREQHLDGSKEGRTCIDCHDDGIAHEPVAHAVPESELEQEFLLD
jgi:nitrate/TMAO reductase-like tetraheme cytochrome c subunit